MKHYSSEIDRLHILFLIIILANVYYRILGFPTSKLNVENTYGMNDDPCLDYNMNAMQQTRKKTGQHMTPSNCSFVNKVLRKPSVASLNNRKFHEHHMGPFFEDPANITNGVFQLIVYNSAEASFNCRVGMLRDKTVMWLRKTSEKVSLLTVGNITHSSDSRMRVKFQYPNNWRLIINPVTNKDAGLYMCQVSTHPPRIITTNLTVLETPIQILDEQGRLVEDRYYKIGSTIDLRCQVSKQFLSQWNEEITRSRNNNQMEMIRPTKGKSKQNVIEYLAWIKNKGEPNNSFKNIFSSTLQWIENRLYIAEATALDSGNYTCSLADKCKASVHVQVLTGELPAAIQHNSPTNQSKSLKFQLKLIFLLIYYYLVSY